MRQGKPSADAFHHKLIGNKVTKVLWQDIKPIIMVVASFSHKALLASLWLSSLNITSNFFSEVQLCYNALLWVIYFHSLI